MNVVESMRWRKEDLLGKRNTVERGTTLGTLRSKEGRNPDSVGKKRKSFKGRSEQYNLYVCGGDVQTDKTVGKAEWEQR